jgi:hypothetical protein
MFFHGDKSRIFQGVGILVELGECSPSRTQSSSKKMVADLNIRIIVAISLDRTDVERFCRWKFRMEILYSFLDLTRGSGEKSLGMSRLICQAD